MPTILANSFDAFTMVAHGPSTHDFNPVSSDEIVKIEESVRKALRGIEYSPKASEFVRYSYKKANIGVQFFNNGTIMLSTLAPSGSDDIEYAVGLATMIEGQKVLGTRNNILVDCHNSFNEEKGGVLPGNPEMFQLLDTIKLIEKKELEYEIQVGCHEVMTTDTHTVNTLSAGYNPVGTVEKEKIIDYVKLSIKEAINDLEPVEAGTNTERIIGLKTFGPNNSTELISTISSIVAVSKIIAPLIFIVAILFVLIWIFLF